MNKKWTFLSFVTKSVPFLALFGCVICRLVSVFCEVIFAAGFIICIAAISDFWMYYDASKIEIKDVAKEKESASSIIVFAQDFMFLGAYYVFMLLLLMVFSVVALRDSKKVPFQNGMSSGCVRIDYQIHGSLTNAIHYGTRW